MSEPRVVVQRSGPERPWVGQLVKLDVQLWRPIEEEGKAPPFSFAELRLPGAIARFREEAPPPDEREVDGQRWLVQHRTLVVIPQLDGVVRVPPLVARWNEGDDVRIARSAELEFSAAFPPRGGERLVVSPRLGIEQQLDRSLAGLRVGDGFTRTIVVSATDSDPMALPTLEFAPVSGLELHVAEPRDASNAERGQLSASRTFSATYVVERVGHYDVPEMSLLWLEPGSGHYESVRAPELDFWARPNPHLGLSMWGTTSGSGWVGFGLLLSVLGGLGWVALRRWRRGPFAWERRLRERGLERRAFRRVLAAERSGTPLGRLLALYDWLRARFPAETDRTLDPLRITHEEAAQQLALIERSAFASGGSPPPTHRPEVWRSSRRALAKRSLSAVSLNRRN